MPENEQLAVEKEKLIKDITNHIRKAEDLSKGIKHMQKILDHELKCLHICLSQGLEILGREEPEGLIVYGQPKEKPDTE